MCGGGWTDFVSASWRWQAVRVSGSSLAALEMLLIVAAVGGWGGWQLWSLRRESRRRAEREATGIHADQDPD